LIQPRHCRIGRLYAQQVALTVGVNRCCRWVQRRTRTASEELPIRPLPHQQLRGRRKFLHSPQCLLPIPPKPLPVAHWHETVVRTDAAHVVNGTRHVTVSQLCGGRSGSAIKFAVYHVRCLQVFRNNALRGVPQAGFVFLPVCLESTPRKLALLRHGRV